LFDRFTPNAGRKIEDYGPTNEVSTCAEFTEFDAGATTQAKIARLKIPAANHSAAPFERWLGVILTIALLIVTALALLKRQSRLAANMPKHQIGSKLLIFSYRTHRPA
jgi:hypothetical protein